MKKISLLLAFIAATSLVQASAEKPIDLTCKEGGVVWERDAQLHGGIVYRNNHGGSIVVRRRREASIYDYPYWMSAKDILAAETSGRIEEMIVDQRIVEAKAAASARRLDELIAVNSQPVEVKRPRRQETAAPVVDHVAQAKLRHECRQMEKDLRRKSVEKKQRRKEEIAVEKAKRAARKKRAQINKSKVAAAAARQRKRNEEKAQIARQKAERNRKSAFAAAKEAERAAKHALAAKQTRGARARILAAKEAERAANLALVAKEVGGVREHASADQEPPVAQATVLYQSPQPMARSAAAHAGVRVQGRVGGTYPVPIHAPYQVTAQQMLQQQQMLQGQFLQQAQQQQFLALQQQRLMEEQRAQAIRLEAERREREQTVANLLRMGSPNSEPTTIAEWTTVGTDFAVEVDGDIDQLEELESASDSE